LDSLKLDPGVKELAWATHYVTLNQWDQAIKSYQAAIELAPANASAWLRLVSAHLAAGHNAEALATLAEAARKNPQNTDLATLQASSALLRDAAADADLRPLIASILRDPAGSAPRFELLRIMLAL